MNIRKIKAKHIVALALTLFMVSSMLLACAHAAYPATGTPPYLDIVGTGGAASTSTTNIPLAAVGTQFSIDVRVDNYADVNLGSTGASNGISGVSYDVTWNPAVLTYVSYSEVNWLPSQSNAGDLQNQVASGKITFGQIAFSTSNPFAVASSATGSVSATITFQVAAAGTSALTLTPQGAGVPYIVAPQTVGTLTSGHAVTGSLTYNALYNPQTTVSLYANPADSANTFQFAAGTDPIGQTFQVDMYINNPNAVQVWGWNLGVTWNAAAIQLTGITEGTYLSTSNLNNANGASTIFVPGYVDNNAGNIPQGISDVYLSDSTTTNPQGVLCTLTFTVISFTSSNINLVQGIPSLETLVGTTPTAVTPAPVLQNFQYITNSPAAPTSPVAKITNGATTYTNGQALSPAFNSGASFGLTAANSVPGMDVIPNSADLSYPSYPVTGYSWSFTATAGAPTLFTSPTTTETLSFLTPTVNSLTTYTVSLTVTTASNPNDASYIPTSIATTFSFQVQPASTAPTTAGALLDIYVTNPGTPVYNPSVASTTNPMYVPDGNNGNPLAAGTSAYTPNSYSDAFGPQAAMILTCVVTFNGAPVANKEVTFNVVNNQGVVIGTYTAMTDENGIATVSYRLPWFDGTYATGPASEFGIWSVKGAVEVQQTIVTDNMPFDFGDIISIVSGSVTPASSSVPRSTLTISTSQSFTVGLSGISDQSQAYWMSYTVIDAGNVPVATGVVSSSMPAAAYSSTGGLTVTPSTSSTGASFVIPSYAFVGTATIVVNLYNANPVTSLNTAVTYCPQASATFTIAIPFGE